MIYHFPDLDTLQLAITSGVVPQDVSLAPAKGGLDDDGQVWLQPSVALNRKAQTALRRLGVEIVRANGELEGDEYCCWLQLLPVTRSDSAVPTPQTPVLFELADADQLPVLVGEILRLGNDRQSFRWLRDGPGSRVLLRVIGPPYYSLLRALESDGQTPAPRAYIERAPRVWVEFGYTHALVEKIGLKEGRFLLMRPPRDWTFIDDAAFQDVYDVLDFQLPEGRVSWRDAALESRIRVRLRLAPASTSEAPELWVLRDHAIEQLDALVQSADETLLDQLIFAVGEWSGQTSIVVRVRTSKKTPPALALQAESYRPYQRMPNLFVPHGRRLHPPLRRDAVRKLLANDPDQITWLVAEADGSFRPESLPDTAFRPLRDWVEYVLDREQQALTTWMQAARFDFESFVCKDDQRPATPKPATPERKRSKEPQEAIEPVQPEPTTAPAKTARRPKEQAQFTPVPAAKPDELERRRAALERQFVEIEGALDAPERQRLWPEMAALNAALNQPADAAICWQHALWEAETPDPALAQHWAQTEAAGTAAKALERLLARPDPPSADVRAVAACVVACPDAVAPRLGQVRGFLEQYETRLGVRAAWLAWRGLTGLSHGDVLGLARARDRLLERLLAHGLSMEHDLPSFLRFSGHQSSDRLRMVRNHLLDMRERAHDFIERSYKVDGDVSPDPPSWPSMIKPEVAKSTKAYCDLTFAFGFARLGDESESRKLQQAAEKVLDRKDPTPAFLLQAYGYRIEQSIKRKPHGGPLPSELLERLDSLEKQDRWIRYRIDRLRQQSRLLDPHEHVDGFRRMSIAGFKDEHERDLLMLQDVRDESRLQSAVEQFLAHEETIEASPMVRVARLAALLPVLPRLGEKLTIESLDRGLQALEALTASLHTQEALRVVSPLLERGLFLAAHYGNAERVQRFLAWFLRFFAAQFKTDRGPIRELDAIIANCFHGLRKLGLRDEISQLLHQVAELILRGQDLTAVRARAGIHWPAMVRSLLHIAGGWLYFGRVEDALPVLDAAQELLFSGPLVFHEKNPLSWTYAATLGQAPVEVSLPKFMELFPRIGRIWEVQETRHCFSQSQLNLIETVVLAMVSDDFVLGQNARRWLDEDEFLVRRRIHRDVREGLAHAGM
jgi:cellulose synthase operon protein C